MGSLLGGNDDDPPAGDIWSPVADVDDDGDGTVEPEPPPPPPGLPPLPPPYAPDDDEDNDDEGEDTQMGSQAKRAFFGRDDADYTLRLPNGKIALYLLRMQIRATCHRHKCKGRDCAITRSLEASDVKGREGQGDICVAIF